jgi:hypothetical protein
VSTLFAVSLAGTQALDIRASQITCRRSIQSTSITVVAPAVSSAFIAEIGARDGNALSVSMGGEPLFSGILTGIRHDQGSGSASATLTATSGASSGTPATVDVSDISYRNTSGSGRRVRLAVSAVLKPGDSAVLGGGETMTVSEISYSITTTTATMEIGE